MRRSPHARRWEATPESLPGWAELELPTRPDSEDARIQNMYACALRAHFVAATAIVTKASEIQEGERAESRRVLTSMVEPWRSTRLWLCECADVSERHVRHAAIDALAPMLQAERKVVQDESDRDRRYREEYTAKLARREAKIETAPKLVKIATPSKPVKPVKPARWGSVELLAFLASNEAVLDQVEVEEGLIECERRATRERRQASAERARGCAKRAQHMAQAPTIAAE